MNLFSLKLKLINYFYFSQLNYSLRFLDKLNKVHRFENAHSNVSLYLTRDAAQPLTN